MTRLILLLLFCATPVFAQPMDDMGDEGAVDKSLYAEAEAFAKKRSDADVKKYAGQKHILVKPSIVADRKARTVKIYGAAAGLGEEDIVEFFVVQAGSGKAYETLAITFAKPSDIYEAMTFIGMKPGKPVSYRNLRFWPRGERVNISFGWNEKADGTGRSHSIPLEDLVKVDATGKTMEKDGLMYTGSYWYTDEKGKRHFAADVSEAESVASAFNSPDTLFDLPTQAPQGQVYGQYKPSVNYEFKAWWPIEITIKPQKTQRVVDLTLKAKAGTPPKFDLLDKDGKSQVTEHTIRAVLKHFDDLGKKKKDVYVTLDPGEKISLTGLQNVCKLLVQIDRPAGIRVGPPPEGDLYYRAFLPNPRWRKREGRLFHGWEVRLTDTNGKVAASLVSTDDVQDDQGKWIVEDKPYPEASTPDKIAAAIKKVDTRGPRDIFVYAPTDMDYQTLMQWVGPAMKTNPTIHVFVGD